MRVRDRFVAAPLAGRIGAEVSGVHLHADLDAETVGRLRRALLDHRVLFVRDQGHLDGEAQQAVASLFGPLTLSHPTAGAAAGQPRVWPVDATRGGRANHWHTDVTFTDAPPAISLLRAVQVPPYGGDTLWANTVAAYESLPAAFRPTVDQLWARHSNQFDASAKYGEDPASSEECSAREEYATRFMAIPFVADHPVVRVHPETGERAILLGGHALSIRGASRADSEHLYAMIQAAVVRPENAVRWRWRAGDVAIWDNRATQHYAINDYGDFPRLMHRVTVAGERALSIDGRSSVLVDGDTAAYVGGGGLPR